MSRKIAGISLLVCLIVPVLALLVWTQHQKHEVRRAVKWRMAANLDKDELVLLKFTDADAESQLRWKHSKEFEFQGFMYDIVLKEQHTDTTYYWCWWDKEETVLNKRLADLASLALGKDPKQKEKKESVNGFYKNWFHDNPLRIEWDFPLEGYSHESTLHSISNFGNSPPVPPPQVS